LADAVRPEFLNDGLDDAPVTVLLKQSRRDRLARAYESLEGLCCGDAFGERFFVREEMARSLIDRKAIPPPPWRFADDAMMAISIVSTLEERGEINQDCLAASFTRNYDSTRGYGLAMHGLLGSVRQGPDWRGEARTLFGAQGPFGNGSAMSVARWVDLDMVAEQAERSAVTTQCHADTVVGAIAVALAAALGWQQRNMPQLPSASEFLQQIHERTPTSQVRRGIQNAIDPPNGTPVYAATSVLGNGSKVTAQDTFLFALGSAACHLNDYEEALWQQ
jgi:ADP-ribosylglycohydrolase